MAAGYSFAVEGLDALAAVDALPAKILLAARRAVNRTTDHARTVAAREIVRQVNLPASYVAPAGGRLSVTKKAQGTSLEGVVTGRRRPTSLARFVTKGRFAGKGVSVTVEPGTAKTLPGAFLMPLRAGSSGDLLNVGLAVRTKSGQKPRKAYKPLPIGKNLYLLFGPSIDQVFRTVAPDIVPQETEFLETEFRRLMATDGF